MGREGWHWGDANELQTSPDRGKTWKWSAARTSGLEEEGGNQCKGTRGMGGRGKDAEGGGEEGLRVLMGNDGERGVCIL